MEENFKKSEENILSVGIDIGTTTTQIVFSEIKLQNLSAPHMTPRIKVSGRRVLHKGEISFTPLLKENEIDYDGVRGIVDKAYAQAGIRPEAIATGAVIITGESAKRDNSQKVLALLSSYAGSFVATVAGPELEAVYAGKGSGAAALSEAEEKNIANIDIGGGTTNIAIFQKGQPVSAMSLDVGGRHIILEPMAGENEKYRILYASEKVTGLARKKGLGIKKGEVASKDTLLTLCHCLAEIIVECLMGGSSQDLEFMLTNKTKLQHTNLIQAVAFSGGVAKAIYEPVGEAFAYGDIGMLLGKAVGELVKKRPCTAKDLPPCTAKDLPPWELLMPEETIRATVIGAGVHAMTLSGSTIYYDKSLLPLKNIPVMKIDGETEKDMGQLAGLLQEKVGWLKLEEGYQVSAFSLQGAENPTYQYLHMLADALAAGLKDYIHAHTPLVLLFQSDMAKAMGQTLRLKLGEDYPLICVDTLIGSEGDFIDIGNPLSQERVLPVVIKTLTFG